MHQEDKFGTLWRNGNPCILLVGMQVGGTATESSMVVLEKFKNRIIILSRSFTSGWNPKEFEVWS